MSASRPISFESFHGQTEIVNNLAIAVTSSMRQGKPLAHILLAGPGGLGKTTLGAHIVPQELGAKSCIVNCAAIDKVQELTTVLTTVRERDVLFLDEVHALRPECREHLLTAMEDFHITIKFGDKGEEQVMNVDLPHFTIIAATTRQGILDGPLRSRFRHTYTLQPYDTEELSVIAHWHAAQDGYDICKEAALLLSAAAKGIARNVVNLLHNCIDTHVAGSEEFKECPVITVEIAEHTLIRLGYHKGLSPDELRYLKVIREHRLGDAGIGLSTIAARLDEAEITVQAVIEPWLLRSGLVERTSCGRIITKKALELLE